MNHWSIEVLAESRRGQILAEMDQLRLVQQAQKVRLSQSSLFGSGMLRLADWMIAAGRELRCRYDLRAADCGPTVGDGLARQGW